MPDVFISHASEDKDLVARPLASALESHGCDVWFDETTLRLGDSLRREIDRGLAACKFGVVILSPAFFSKEWPQRELDGLVSREAAEREKRILPIWHNLSAVEVAKYSPTLADRLSISTTSGLDPIVTAILDIVQPSGPHSGRSTDGSFHRARGITELLEEAVLLAKDYLLPQPPSLSDAVEALIRNSLATAQEHPTPDVLMCYLRSGDAARRVVGYIALQVAAESKMDVAPLALELTACLSRECAEVAKRKDTRALLQLLQAQWYVFATPGIIEEKVRARAVLRDVLGFLERNRRLDPGGECKLQIRGFLQY